MNYLLFHKIKKFISLCDMQFPPKDVNLPPIFHELKLIIRNHTTIMLCDMKLHKDLI